MELNALIGAGGKIGRLVFPFIVVGLAFNILLPSIFSVGGSGTILKDISIPILGVGLIFWIWSVALILIYVPKHKLITRGPYRIMKHPLYIGVALLVLPWFGFLCNSWLGLCVGAAIFAGSKLYSKDEELLLEKIFGKEWIDYKNGVLLSWL